MNIIVTIAVGHRHVSGDSKQDCIQDVSN